MNVWLVYEYIKYKHMCIKKNVSLLLHTPPEHCYPVMWWFARMSKARPLRIPRTKKQTETEKDIIAKAEERMRGEKSYLNVNAGITRLLFQCAYLCTIILRCSLTHIFSFSSPCQDSLVCERLLCTDSSVCAIHLAGHSQGSWTALSAVGGVWDKGD